MLCTRVPTVIHMITHTHYPHEQTYIHTHCTLKKRKKEKAMANLNIVCYIQHSSASTFYTYLGAYTCIYKLEYTCLSTCTHTLHVPRCTCTHSYTHRCKATASGNGQQQLSQRPLPAHLRPHKPFSVSPRSDLSPSRKEA